MIYGIGTDIVSIKRIEAALSKQGERLSQRILSEDEKTEFNALTQPAATRFLAKRFAVKEAFSKAFGSGIGADVGWHDVRISHDDKGKPIIVVSAALQQRLSDNNIGSTHVSISDEVEHAIAFVVLEKNEEKTK
jgi:holo-[acyl-carrier protein] synthase